MTKEMLMINRRVALGLLGAAAIPSAGVVVVSAAAAETPNERVTRLAEELSHALNEYADGRMHAVVYPSKDREWAISLRVTDLEPAPLPHLHHQIERTKIAMAKAYPDKDIRTKFMAHKDGNCTAIVLTVDA